VNVPVVYRIVEGDATPLDIPPRPPQEVRAVCQVNRLPDRLKSTQSASDMPLTRAGYARSDSCEGARFQDVRYIVRLFRAMRHITSLLAVWRPPQSTRGGGDRRR